MKELRFPTHLDLVYVGAAVVVLNGLLEEVVPSKRVHAHRVPCGGRAGGGFGGAVV